MCSWQDRESEQKVCHLWVCPGRLVLLQPAHTGHTGASQAAVSVQISCCAGQRVLHTDSAHRITSFTVGLGCAALTEDVS